MTTVQLVEAIEMRPDIRVMFVTPTGTAFDIGSIEEIELEEGMLVEPIILLHAKSSWKLTEVKKEKK